MTPTDLLKQVRQRPFTPFRLIASEGGSYLVRHPDQIMVRRDSVIIGVEGSAGFFEDTVVVDLLHVVRVESAPVPAPGNGNPASGS